jgi:outer membrane protein OmpA-like peptidoglycan-associated protein/Tol biopolymer transport system component
MKKRLYSYLAILLVSLSTLQAQSKKTEKADKLFNRLEYVAAIEAYLELAQKDENDAYIHGQLAEAYYNIFDTQAAERWLAKIVGSKNDADTYFKYAQMLKANGKQDEANAAMEKFASLAPNDLRAKDYKRNPRIVAQLLNEAPKYSVRSVKGINSANSDFGPVLFKSALYYVSSKASKSRRYGWNDQPYLDLYVSDYAGGELSNEQAITDDIQTRFNEGTVSFSPDGNTMYFTRESFYERKFVKDEQGKSTINIYSATKDNGKWTNVVALPFNGDNYNSSAPAVSPDGKQLYFSSDMPGGFGGADIWVVDITGDAAYSEPRNLGNIINTEAREGFPYVSSTQVLYFSSNGHNGLGNLDVFAAQIKEGTFGAVRNLGSPINTGKDDFSFTIDEAAKQGFFASNRAGGMGDDDIYAFEQIQALCDVDLIVTVIDNKTKAILRDASVVILDENQNKIAEKTSDYNGQVFYKYECDQAWNLTAAKTDYQPGTAVVAKTDQPEVSVTIALDPIEKLIVADKIVLEPIYFPFDKHNITAQAAEELDKLVAIMKKYPNMHIEASSHTDFRGNDDYNLALSDRRAKATRQYVISKGIAAARLTAVGKGEKEPKVACGGNCTEAEHQQNRRSEFTITKQ